MILFGERVGVSHPVGCGITVGLTTHVRQNRPGDELLQHRQYPAAETYLRECLTIREKKLPNPGAPGLFNTKSMLGGAGQVQGESVLEMLASSSTGEHGIERVRDSAITPEEHAIARDAYNH